MRSRVWEWTRFLARRLGQLIIVLLGVSIITFVVTHAIGSPVYLVVGQTASEEVIETMIHKLGLDRPLWEQYLTYVRNLARGDWGTSRYSFNPVTLDLGNRLPATLELSMYSLLLGTLWGVPAGIMAAVKKGGLLDSFIQFLAKIGTSVPGFWLGLILIYIFFAQLHVLPGPLGRLEPGVAPPPRITGWLTIDSLLTGNRVALVSSLRQLFLPALTLAFTVSPSLLQLTRNTMDRVLENDFIRAARAFGLSPLTIYLRYALKNVAGPVITMVAMTFGYLVGGTVLVEVVFSWPGLGLYAVDAMNHSDYEPIVGVVLFCTLLYNLAYVLSDIISAVIDPRARV